MGFRFESGIDYQGGAGRARSPRFLKDFMPLRDHMGEPIGVEDMDAGKIMDSLSGRECYVCGSLKKEWKAFCSDCYWSLGPVLREKLWRRFGQGFEDAFRAAARKLIEERSAEESAR